MLLESEKVFEGENEGGSFAVAMARPAFPPVAAPAAELAPRASVRVSGGRYGEGRKFSPTGIAIAVGVHLAMLPLLLGLGQQFVAKKSSRLVVMDLSPPPAPPRQPSPSPPEAKKLETSVRPPQPPLTPVTVPRPPLVLADTAPSQSVAIQPAAVAAPPAPPAPPAAPAPPAVVSSSSLGTRMISGSPPRYPLESRRRKEQGTVELLLILGVDGAVETISVAHSSGFARLDDAALSAVRRWRWSPTTRDGTPVKVRGTVEIPFVLQGA